MIISLRLMQRLFILFSFITYSINRIRMEIYQFSKYENIADRLKRLASNANYATATPVDTLQLQGQKAIQYGNVARKENMNTELQSRTKYLQNFKNSKSSKFATLETEYRPEEQKQYRVKQLTSPRENKTDTAQERQRKNINTRYVESKTNLIIQSEKTQDRSVPWKNAQQPEGKTGDRKKTLSKVKSDSNIKIEDILESFNNYKQNKEKFLTTIGKTFVNEQSSAKECLRQENHQDKKRAFKPIDYIWNEQSQEKGQKIQRSLKSFRQASEEGNNNFSETSPSQKSYLDRRNFTKPTLASKNTTNYQDLSYTQKPQMKALLSPRGTRIPGKICRNL